MYERCDGGIDLPGNRFDITKKTYIMKKIIILAAWTLFVVSWASAIDMQAHLGTKEAQEAYTAYVAKQKKYYKGVNAPDSLRAKSGNVLFGALNTLMGNTNQIGGTGYSYNKLREQYVNVDKDLNVDGNIIGYYDGSSMNGTWDSGKTYNREHTWPQSKGADKSTPMGYDMQSVRPANTAINGDRGSTAYGESGSYYDPDEISINNSWYVPTNLGSYRGDCARVILYDYVVYGEAGGYKNSLYIGNAQLLSKLGAKGVFESIRILLKWHMNDPISLTEMVRNDGAHAYQGNRNPFIDYPELAILMLKDANGVTTYPVTTTDVTLWPAYSLTLADGFIAYLGDKTNRPESVTVTGATSTYDPKSGRLTIKNVTGNVTITAPTVTAIEHTADGQKAVKVLHRGQVLILKNGKAYNTLGVPVEL